MDWKKIKAEYIAGGTSSTVTDAKPNYLQNTIFGGDVVYNKNQEDPSHFILRLKSLNKALPTYDREGSSKDRISQPEKEVKDVLKKSRITSEQDSTYLDAVNRGDMETAQKMVDEAANALMPNSLVKDANGKLLLVYHGSPSKFTVFKHNKMNVHGNAHGRGFYFTENKSLAEGYEKDGGQLLRGYLNIEKTLSEDKLTIKKSDLVKLIKTTCEAQAKSLVEDDGYDNIREALPDTWISNYVMTYGMNINDAYREVANIIYSSAENDVEIIAELTNAGAGKENTLTLTKEVLGYDGVIYTNPDGNHEFVSLVSNQFKSADPVTYDDNGNVIPLSERFNESNKDIRYKSRNVDNTMTNGTYSYSALTSKPDLKVIEFSGTLPLNSKGEIDKNEAIARGRANARKQKNPKNTETSTYVYVDDLGIDVLLSKNGMTHGIVRSPETASAVMQIGDVLKNSFAINELEGSRERKTEMSYVLLGACKDAENIYVVRSVVSKLLNEVTEIDVFQLSAIKGKKIETPTSALGGTAVTEQRSLISSESSAISIADFLGYVKTIPLANEVFSQNVAEYLEIERHQGTLSKDLRHKSRSTVTSGQYEQMKANLSHSNKLRNFKDENGEVTLSNDT